MNNIIFKIKFRKVLKQTNTIEKYYDYVENCSLSKLSGLMIGSTEKLSDTTYENIFQPLESYNILRNQYRLNEIAGCDTDFEKVKNIMNWLSQNTYYCGNCPAGLPDNTLNILKYSYKKPFKYAINCRDRAIAFADCLLALNIKSYPIMLLCKQNYNCHFVVHVYIKEYEKWCVFDPSFNNYFTDENNNILDVFELRQLFLDGKVPNLNGYSIMVPINKTRIYKST